MTDARRWYYAREGKAAGPCTFAELQGMAAAGQLATDVQVCGDGKNWQPARSVPGLEFGAPGQSQLGYQARSQGMPMITPRTVELVGQTSLWVRILAIFMFIVTGLAVVGAAFMIIAAILSRGRGSTPMLTMGLVYIAMSALYVIPSLLMWRYASQCKAFASLRHEQQLEDAIGTQKTLWKYSAILTLVIAGIYLLILLFALIGLAMSR
jgi:hypothetical protein